MNAYQEVERLLSEISQAAKSPAIIRKTEEISVLCRAYMEPDQAEPFPEVFTTPSRRKMLALLIKRKGQVVSRSALMDCLAHDDFEPDSRIVDVHICQLRQALINTKYENMIETVWGTGFRFRTEKEGPIIPSPIAGKTNAAKYYNSRIAA